MQYTSAREYRSAKVLGIAIKERKVATETFVVKCQSIIARMVRDCNDQARIRAIAEIIRPFMKGRTLPIQIAVTSFIILRFSQATSSSLPAFNKLARSMGVPAPSLRTALESVARTMRIEWKGTSTDFTARIVEIQAEKEGDENKKDKKDKISF